MAKKQRYTQQQVIDAIRQADGFISQAAHILDCAAVTVYDYINRYPAIKEALGETKTKRDDFVESKLLKLIKDENPTAIIFYLKTQAKHRGYVERQEVTGADGEPLLIRLDK